MRQEPGRPLLRGEANRRRRGAGGRVVGSSFTSRCRLLPNRSDIDLHRIEDLTVEQLSPAAAPFVHPSPGGSPGTILRFLRRMDKRERIGTGREPTDMSRGRNGRSSHRGYLRPWRSPGRRRPFRGHQPVQAPARSRGVRGPRAGSPDPGEMNLASFPSRHDADGLRVARAKGRPARGKDAGRPENPPLLLGRIRSGMWGRPSRLSLDGLPGARSTSNGTSTALAKRRKALPGSFDRIDGSRSPGERSLIRDGSSDPGPRGRPRSQSGISRSRDLPGKSCSGPSPSRERSRQRGKNRGCGIFRHIVPIRQQRELRVPRSPLRPSAEPAGERVGQSVHPGSPGSGPVFAPGADVGNMLAASGWKEEIPGGCGPLATSS